MIGGFTNDSKNFYNTLCFNIQQEEDFFAFLLRLPECKKEQGFHPLLPAPSPSCCFQHHYLVKQNIYKYQYTLIYINTN